MRIERAREIARKWVLDEGTRLPGFEGAFLTGSVLWADPGDELAPHSDVDVMVVTGSAEAGHIGKFRYEGVLLEVSTMAAPRSVHDVLGDYHLAGSLHLPGLLADPTGRLAEIQRGVARGFAERPWVLARCTAAMNLVRARLTGIDESAPLPAQVTSWLFGTGVTAHVLLVAGLRNPTVRRRYAAVRDLLAEHGRLDRHEILLDLLGCAHLGRSQVEGHLETLERVFDATAELRVPGYRFDTDLSPAARPCAIDGTRELIGAGLHREAVFWLVATYARCLDKRALAGERGYEDGFRALLADLGAATRADRRRRAGRVLAALPELWRTATGLLPA